MIISSMSSQHLIMDMLDRFRGCLYGAAVGDALGMPTEGYTAKEIRSKFGIGSRYDARPGWATFTPAFWPGSSQTIPKRRLCWPSPSSKPPASQRRVLRKSSLPGAQSWTLDERLSRGVGFATRSAVESMIAGTPWQESGLSIPTCGSAMRAAPIGLLYHSDLNIVSRAMQTCRACLPIAALPPGPEP